MHSNFSETQLKNERISEVNRILTRCVHCGLCTAVCPTYVLLGDERDSPRGRIYLIKDMFERKTAPTAEVRHHVDRCLSCLSCTSTCPSGVDYMHLVDIARAHLAENGHQGIKKRVLRWLLATVLPYPRRFKWAMTLAPLGRPFAPFFDKIGLKEVRAMLELAPTETLSSADYAGPGTAATKMERKARVILPTGCVQKVIRPEINDATIRLLARRGIDVVVAAGAGCCGALVHHIGKENDAKEQAKRNIDAWMKEIERAPVDAIISNASGCGTMVKDYAHLLRNDEDYAEKAKQVSALAKDITEFLVDVPLGAPVRWSSLRVAYHSACSLRHGQRVIDEPKTHLTQAGYSVVDVPEGHICCGSAGVYNIMQPDLAEDLRKRKLGHIRSVKPDLIAMGNIGCMTQLERGNDLPVAHTVELLDWAYGGPVPRGLDHLEQFVSDVPKPKHKVSDFIDA